VARLATGAKLGNMATEMKLVRRGNPKKISRALLVVLIIAALCVWLSFNVWTAPVGFAWHLVHGGHVSFQGHTMAVPWDMAVTKLDSSTLMMVRTAAEYSLSHSPPVATIIIERSQGSPPGDFAETYRRMNQASEALPSARYRFLGVRPVNAAKASGFRWESLDLPSSQLSITCLFDGDPLTGVYSGSTAYRDEFYTILGAASK
jgi:hypothetical protein